MWPFPSDLPDIRHPRPLTMWPFPYDLHDIRRVLSCFISPVLFSWYDLVHLTFVISIVFCPGMTFVISVVIVPGVTFVTSVIPPDVIFYMWPLWHQSYFPPNVTFVTAILFLSRCGLFHVTFMISANHPPTPMMWPFPCDVPHTSHVLYWCDLKISVVFFPDVTFSMWRSWYQLCFHLMWPSWYQLSFPPWWDLLRVTFVIISVIFWHDRGAGIAQCRTRDWKVAGSNPCWSGRRIFFSRVNFLCWLLFRYPFHPRVTAVACKRPRSFC